MNYFEQFLAARHLTEDDLKNMFSYEKMYIKGTDDVCQKLHKLPRDVKIACMSDYDTDGFFAGTIDFIGLHFLGFRNMRIAQRDIAKGYHFDKEDIDNLGDIDVMITTDVGISCIEAIEYAKSKGICVIVTDHHVPTGGAAGNKADIIVDYLLDGNFRSANVEVCGAYTIYQIYERYVELYPDEFANLNHVKSDLQKLKYLAAIATVADSMPLIGVNHCMVSDMLHFFNYINPMDCREADIVKGVCYDPILQNVYNNLHTFVSVIADNYYTGFDMRFLEYSFIPVINSIKRMSESVSLFYNMLFGSPEDALEAATIMLELNTDRKELVNDLFNRMFVLRENQMFPDLIYMIDGPSGLLGLLAAKAMNETKLPTVVLSSLPRFDDVNGRWCYDGSIRSPKWYPFLSRVSSSGYATCSGHEFACAITVPVDCMDNLYKFLVDDIERYGIISNKPVTKSEVLSNFDVVLDYDANFFDFVNDVEEFMFDMQQVAPFGSGFPEPSIILKFNKCHGAVSSLKEGKHTKIKIAPEFDVLLWNTTCEDVDNSTDGVTVCVKGYLAVSYFQGKRSINFIASPVLTGDEI